jgi:hypothetical protein
MRIRFLLLIGMSISAVVSSQGAASAESCSDRAAICKGACTPALVSSGQQHGGTVQGCVGSCQSRLRSCLRTGVWVHMGSQNRGMRQKVYRR